MSRKIKESTKVGKASRATVRAAVKAVKNEIFGEMNRMNYDKIIEAIATNVFRLTPAYKNSKSGDLMGMPFEESKKVKSQAKEIAKIAFKAMQDKMPEITYTEEVDVSNGAHGCIADIKHYPSKTVDNGSELYAEFKKLGK